MHKSIMLNPFPICLKCSIVKNRLPEDALGLTELADDGNIYVKLSLQPSLPEVYSTALHEAVHVVQFLQQRIETTFDIETEAYMVEFVANWLFKCVQKFACEKCN